MVVCLPAYLCDELEHGEGAVAGAAAVVGQLLEQPLVVAVVPATMPSQPTSSIAISRRTHATAVAAAGGRLTW